LDEVKARVALLRASGVSAAIPADLVTKSASGLDPHVSPAAAALQVPRIASTRKIPEAQVTQLIASHTEGSTLGFMGEPRVNVLLVNLDLDAQAPYSAPPKPASSAAPAK
jgi:K+-transporting ATPase ATPase C chain